jgi:general secretion pathway protein A
VRRAASEVFDKRLTPAWLPWVLGTATLLVVASAALVAWSLYQRARAVPPAPAPAAAVAEVVEPAPAPEPVVAPAPDLATLLRDSAAATGLDGAYAKLFALWSATYVPGSEDACSQALRQGLECLNEGGGFDMLRRFNRPAILSVSDVNGTVHQVVVARISQDNAQLMIGDTTHDIAIADLAQRWNGDFQLLWKPPQLDTRNLSLGMQGEPIGVLRNRLRQWAGLAPDPAPNQVFDASLETLVRQFQLRSGLTADGVAGVQTQAVLDSAMAGVDSPLLSAVTP